MKALVVYESMWGNTEKVADAIAAGLGEEVGGGGADHATAQDDDFHAGPICLELSQSRDGAMR